KRHVPVIVQDAPQRGGDLPLGQDARRALVQQRLEQVVLRTVEQGHVNRGTPQRPGREQAREAAADDYHSAPVVLVVHGTRRPSFVRSATPAGQPAGSCQESRSGSSRSASLGPPLPPPSASPPT